KETQDMAPPIATRSSSSTSKSSQARRSLRGEPAAPTPKVLLLARLAQLDVSIMDFDSSVDLVLLSSAAATITKPSSLSVHALALFVRGMSPLAMISM